MIICRFSRWQLKAFQRKIDTNRFGGNRRETGTERDGHRAAAERENVHLAMTEGTENNGAISLTAEIQREFQSRFLCVTII